MVPKGITHKLVVLSLLSASLLCGCAATPNMATLEAEGVARQVPILIYFASWTTPWFPGNHMEVQFINTQDKVITSVQFMLVHCGRGANLSSIKRLTLTGPYKPKQAYSVQPTLPGGIVPNAIPGLSGGEVVVELKVINSDGTEREYIGKQVAPLFGNYVSNSCPA